jgi:hypothetical protein
MTRSGALARFFVAMGLLGIAAYPTIAGRLEVASLLRRVDGALASSAPAAATRSRARFSPDPALLVGVESRDGLLASWQTIAGCGAGSATGGGTGVKWIGRNVSGGLFNVTEQASYTHLPANPKEEKDLFLNTLITYDLTHKWVLGVNIPIVYKYLYDPFSLGYNVSNSGLGDMGFQLTRKFGAINDTLVTAVVGTPTGNFDTTYKMKPFSQSQQLGFGKYTGTLLVDHILDQVWGIVVVGGLASWRGGHNKLDNYRAPSATGYAYTGYFLGPLVPTVGFGITGFTRHDQDQTQDLNSGLLVFAGNVSIEWSTDWIAVLAGASFPYQYDGVRTDAFGMPRSPWRFAPWIASIGVAISPF